MEGSNSGLIEVSSPHLPEETEGNHEKKKTVRIATVSAEIRTEHCPNMSLQRYLNYSPLG
jgi:hypothetical protein